MQKSRLYIIVGGSILLFVLCFALFFRDNARLINLEEFEQFAAQGAISSVVLDESYARLKVGENLYKIPKEIIEPKALKRADIEVSSTSLGWILEVLTILIALVFSLVLFFALRPRQGAKAPQTAQNLAAQNEGALEVSAIKSEVRFGDIAGIKEVKDDLLEIIDYLKNPAKYQKMGIHLPKGVLLVGPPGVGKTMIAKAIANEANVPFFYQSGSSFAQIYVGVGAKRVRELFWRAKASAPSIVFIDEIDAVGKARGGNRNDEREATLNQLLTEMDGFEDSRGVIVVGATNRVEILDAALLRAGRFDRRIYIDLPDFSERCKIIELYLRGKNHSVNIEEIARQSVGFSGAGLESLVNEASLNALRKNAAKITDEDFHTSHSRVIGGVKKQLSFSEKEKNILSLYQAAKALCAYWCDVEFEKISLLGEGFKPHDGHIFSRTDLMNKIKVALSGTVALEGSFGESFTNAYDDLQAAKEIARQMCENYAMAGRIFGDYSDVEALLNEAKEELSGFFANAKSALKQAQEMLLKNEKITKDEVGVIFRREVLG